MSEPTRQPPHDPGAEKTLVGAVILNPDILPEMLESLEAEKFYVPLYRAVFEAQASLFEKDELINPVTIAGALRATGKAHLAQSGALGDLYLGLPSVITPAPYIKRIQDMAARRALIKVAAEIQESAYDESEPADEVLERAEGKIFQLAERRVTGGFLPLHHLSALSLERAAERAAPGSTARSGISTGFRDLDDKTGGWQPTDLIILSGRTSMGKSGFLLSCIDNATTADPDIVVALHTLEMSAEQVTARMLCARAKVDSTRYRQGFLGTDEWRRFAEAQAWWDERRIFVDDTRRISTMEIRAKCRRLLAQEKRLDLIGVDHIQFVKGAGKHENRQLEVSGITADLKTIAHEFNCPVLAVSHVSRATETRGGDMRPKLSDLRESGSIENDADVVGFLFRPEYYHPTEENHGEAEFILAKARNGPIGTIPLVFLSQYTRFESAFRE